MPDREVEHVVAANVRHLRTARGLTQGELAGLASKPGHQLTEQRLWALENRRRRITVADLSALAEALGVNAQTLLSGDAAQLIDGRPPVAHAVTLEGGITEVVTAHRTDVDEDGWLNFYLGDERVFFAPAVNVLGVRIAGQEATRG